jgi:S1-C subfamily serine protease
MHRVAWLLAVLLLPLLASAGTLTLNDGTVIEGEIRKVGKSYSVRTPDGRSQLIPEVNVRSVDGVPVNPPGGTPPRPGGGTYGTGGSSNFNAVKREADSITSNPSLGVMLWKKFLQSNPSPEDRTAAEAELKFWEQLAEGNAERVNGKWVSGKELEELHAKVKKLLEDAYAPGTRELNGIAGIRNLEQILRIYPQSFEANFEMGFYYLIQARQHIGSVQNIDKAIRSLEAATRIAGDIPESWTNLAIAYNFRKRYEDSVRAAWKAVEMADEKELVQNLANALAHAPPGFTVNNPRVRAINERAQVLFRKHGITGGGNKWTYMRPDPRRRGMAKQPGGGDDDDSAGPPGIFGNGTGFLISADGYIMTNEHVAKPGDYLVVRLHDGNEYLARRVVIDDTQDIAILKIDAPTPLTFIRIAEYDAPAVGSEVTVLGFPLLSQFGLRSSVKVTRGIVTAYDKDQPKVDVTVDAQVNPGNSGGPMVDKFGNLMALVAMKTLATDASVSSYGLGLSNGRLRTFFKKHEAKLASLKLEAGKPGEQPLTTEQIVQKVAPATVVILMCRGEVPASLKGETDTTDGPSATPSEPSAPAEPSAPSTPPRRKGGDFGGSAG